MIFWLRPTAIPGGDGYARLKEAFERLAGTRITTNLQTGGVDATRGFGLIESWEILRHSRGKRMISVTVTLSEWLYRAVLSKSVLTLSEITFACANRWSGGFMNWRASIAAASPTGESASRRCITNPARPRRFGCLGPRCAE